MQDAVQKHAELAQTAFRDGQISATITSFLRNSRRAALITAHHLRRQRVICSCSCHADFAELRRHVTCDPGCRQIGHVIRIRFLRYGASTTAQWLPSSSSMFSGVASRAQAHTCPLAACRVAKLASVRGQ